MLGLRRRRSSLVGEVLVTHKVITQEQLDDALQRQNGNRLGEVVIGLGVATESEAERAIYQDKFARGKTTEKEDVAAHRRRMTDLQLFTDALRVRSA